MFLASNKKRQSSDLEGTPNPKMGQKQNGVKTPKSGFKQTPKSGLKMQTPKANFKPGTPKSNEKKKFPKNGARKSLAVNGSPKVEKLTSNEEATAVKVEAVANLPANKNKGRKRSLSEPGAGPVAKAAKLKKFAGTASLTADKKGPPNRSAKKRLQTKEKRKEITNLNKLKIREKVLAGDIETVRELQSKLNALLAKPVADRNNSNRRRIRMLLSMLNSKAKKEGDDSQKVKITVPKVQKQKPGQKKNQQKVKKELVKSEQQSGEVVSAGTKKTQKPAQKKNQEVIKKELELTEDASDASDDEVSNEEGDSEMLSAESDEDVGEEGSEEDSDEEDSDNDEGDSDDEEGPLEFVVDHKGQKPTQKPVNSKPQSPAQNKGKPFGKFGNKKFGNNKFAGRQKKGPQKK